MSLSAVCLAARDRIRSYLSLGEDSCEVGFDGQPKPMAGQLYVAVHPASWTGTDNDYELEEIIAVNVTVTMRLGSSPKDRWGVAVWTKQDDGLDAVCRKVIVALHMNYADVMNVANTTYITTARDGFYHPLKFRDGGLPRYVDHHWFSAAEPESQYQVAEAGVAQTLTFGALARFQTIGGMA